MPGKSQKTVQGQTKTVAVFVEASLEFVQSSLINPCCQQSQSSNRVLIADAISRDSCQPNSTAVTEASLTNTTPTGPAVTRGKSSPTSSASTFQISYELMQNFRKAHGLLSEPSALSWDGIHWQGLATVAKYMWRVQLAHNALGQRSTGQVGK